VDLYNSTKRSKACGFGTGFRGLGGLAGLLLFIILLILPDVGGNGRDGGEEFELNQ
jgi:hypothetical protein